VKTLPLPRFLASAALLLVATNVAARTETLEIPLDILAGDQPWSEQTLDFDAGGALAGLHEARLRVTGECGDQIWVFCMNFQFWSALPGDLEIGLYGEPGGPALDRISHAFPPGPPAPVTLEWAFDLADPGDLEAIADGTGRIVLADPATMFFSDEAGGFVCPVGPPCALESASLILVFEEFVAVSPTIWGTVKSLYR